MQISAAKVNSVRRSGKEIRPMHQHLEPKTIFLHFKKIWVHQWIGQSIAHPSKPIKSTSIRYRKHARVSQETQKKRDAIRQAMEESGIFDEPDEAFSNELPSTGFHGWASIQSDVY